MKTCKGCEIEFEPNFEEQLFHSMDCCYQSRTPSWQKLERICEGCGISYFPKEADQKYHNHKCWIMSNEQAEVLKRTSRLARSKGGTIARAKQRAKSTGYVKVPGTQTFEHRAVAEVVLGRTLEPCACPGIRLWEVMPNGAS